MRCPSCGSRNRAVRGTCTVCNTVLPTDPALTQAATELPADVSPSDDAVTVTVRPSVPDRLRPDDPDADETRVPRRARAPIGPLTVGEAFGSRYKIVKVLGVGGMGAVYKAWDQELGVSVALKVIRAEVMEDPFVARELELRFKRELLLGRKVTHKNVVRIHDIGEIRGVKYITMPYIEGSDLATILKREGKLPVRRALRIARSVASGLAAAHEAGVVHRGLKPANIMVDAEDEPYITDFGIARSSSAQAAAGGVGKQNCGGTEAESQWLSGHTMAGTVVGTIEYMAPEQAKGEQVDGQADVYAFGLILYDVLVGRPRRKGFTSPKEELTSRMQAAPPAVRTIEGSVPEAARSNRFEVPRTGQESPLPEHGRAGGGIRPPGRGGTAAAAPAALQPDAGGGSDHWPGRCLCVGVVARVARDDCPAGSPVGADRQLRELDRRSDI